MPTGRRPRRRVPVVAALVLALSLVLVLGACSGAPYDTSGAGAGPAGFRATPPDGARLARLDPVRGVTDLSWSDWEGPRTHVTLACDDPTGTDADTRHPLDEWEVQPSGTATGWSAAWVGDAGSRLVAADGVTTEELDRFLESVTCRGPHTAATAALGRGVRRTAFGSATHVAPRLAVRFPDRRRATVVWSDGATGSGLTTALARTIDGAEGAAPRTDDVHGRAAIVLGSGRTWAVWWLEAGRLFAVATDGLTRGEVLDLARSVRPLSPRAWDALPTVAPCDGRSPAGTSCVDVGYDAP